MTKTDSGVEVGKLDERVEVLELLDLRELPDFEEEPSSDAEEKTGIPPPPSGASPFNKGGLEAEEPPETEAEQPPPSWEWQAVRRTWGRVTLTERKNVYSVHGIGSPGVEIILRRQLIDLDSALQWRGQHCLITAIRPLGRLYLRVEAALVELSQCRDPRSGTAFPAVMTEEYVRHDQLEPMAINTHRRVLVTPKAVRLTPGPLVEVDGTPWPILTPYELDPHKNEYVIGRTVDL